MVVKENITQDEFVCPHCRGNSFVFIGLQRQKGLFKDHELWSCKSCRSTFARETIDVKKTSENELFKKRALLYYYKIRFAN